jgi:predicted ATPase
MKKIYTELGYDLVPLPLCSVEERMRFILCETSA